MERSGDRAAALAAKEFVYVVSLLANEAASIAQLVRPHERGSEVAARAARHADDACSELDDIMATASIGEAYRAAVTGLSAAAVALTQAREALEVARREPPIVEV